MAGRAPVTPSAVRDALADRIAKLRKRADELRREATELDRRADGMVATAATVGDAEEQRIAELIAAGVLGQVMP